MKRKYFCPLLCVFLILCFIVSGCQSSDSKEKENPITITQSGFYVTETTSNSFEVNVFCEYKNTGKNPIYVTSVNVIGYDKNNVSLGDGYVSQSSYILNPNDTGYGVRGDAYGIKVNSIDELSRIEFKVNTFTANVTDKLLSCSDTQIVPDDLFGDINKNVIQTTTINDTSLNVDTDYEVVAGLFDSNNKMIGAATSLNRPNAISPNGKSRNDLQTLVLESNDLSTIKTIDAKASMYLSVFDNDSFVKSNREMVAESLSEDTPTTTASQSTPPPEQTSTVDGSDSIIGKWNMTHPGTGAENLKVLSVDFKSDGTAQMTEELKDGNKTERTLTYKKDGTEYKAYQNDQLYMWFILNNENLEGFINDLSQESIQSTVYQRSK